MKKQLSPLQIGIFVVFGLAIAFATLLFSGKLPIGQTASKGIKGSLVMWGTYSKATVQEVLDSGLKTYPDLRVVYVQKNAGTFDGELLSALASGKGPDLFFVDHDDLKKRSPQLYEIPFLNFPQATYSGVFINQAERNLTQTGVLAFPLVVDPLVMYYNKDLLSGGFLVAPPKTWAEVTEMAPTLTQKTDAGVITQSTIAMGSFDNISHAKEIMSLLAIQAGNPIVSHDDKKYYSTVNDIGHAGQSNFINAMNLYLGFANPKSPSYSWNPALPTDKDLFLAGKLALYIGYASELQNIRDKNPNLNFDVAFVPQPKSAQFVKTFGRVTSLGISTLSKNKGLAVTFANWFSGADAVKEFANLLGTVPARKDLLADKPKDDSRKTLFYNSAIASRSWYDPDARETSLLFKRLVSGVQSGAIDIERFLPQMNTDLDSLLQKN